MCEIYRSIVGINLVLQFGQASDPDSLTILVGVCSPLSSPK